MLRVHGEPSDLTGWPTTLTDTVVVMALEAAVRLRSVGFGLDEGFVTLQTSTARHVAAGAELRDWTSRIVDGRAVEVAQIGSMSVVGLLAKPLVDLAIGVRDDCDVLEIRARLEGAGWTYRGDAGDEGGHVFMLDVADGRRVAHAHVVEFGGRQWNAYLGLRDLLRHSAAARDRYDAEKRRLAAAHARDRAAYTSGKDDVVAELLALAADDASTNDPPG